MALQARFKKPKPVEPILVKNNGNGEGSLLLSLKQTSVYLGLPLRHVRSLVTNGILKTVPTKTKAFYIARAECDRYVRDLIKATETAQAGFLPKRDIKIDRKKKRHFKIASKRSKTFQTVRFLGMTDAQVQDFFRTAQIDDEGRLI